MTAATIPCKLVSADSVEDYLDRYYKHDRYKGRGSEYASYLLDDYRSIFAERGYIMTSHFDNVTGADIFWPSMPDWATEN